MVQTPISMKRRGLVIAGALGGALPALVLADAAAARNCVEQHAGLGATAGTASSAVVSGRVVAANGTPLANAPVTFHYSNGIAGSATDSNATEPSASAVARVLTDADGRFCAVIDHASVGESDRFLYCLVNHERADATICRIDPAPVDAAANGLTGLRDESGIWRSALRIAVA